MFDIAGKLAVQSWCFRKFKSLDELAEKVKAIGLSRIEICAVHADFGKVEEFEKINATLKGHGITIASLGVQYFGGAAVEESWFRCAKAAGCPMISASFELSKMPDVLATVQLLADRYDINLGIHNHGGWDWLGSHRMLSHIFAQTSKRIGLCLDTAWMLQAGEDPIKFADKFADRLYGVHIKDFTFLPTGRVEDVVVGTANLKLKELMGIITGKAADVCKSVTLEYEGDENNPGPKLIECIEKIREATA